MARDFTIPVSGLQVLMQDADEKLETRQYKKRKTHPKSRGGCGSCKLKRVKVLFILIPEPTRDCLSGHDGPKTGELRSANCVLGPE
jgi:hypothetical protein